MFFNRKKQIYTNEEYEELKRTIWNLQIIAMSLNETAEQFERTLQDLKGELATPNNNEGETGLK